MNAPVTEDTSASLWHRFLCWVNGMCRQDFDPDGDEHVCRCGRAYGASSWGDGHE